VVAHVLLAADSVVPDADNALSARFARATGVGLEVYPPGGGPQVADVFDYCVPACSATDVVPDTLFSVRMVPPSQGAYRQTLMERGTAWTAAGALLLLVALIAFATNAGRALALGILAAVLALTPAGRVLPLGKAFSPAAYFVELLGPLSASSGALLATAAVGFVAVLQLPNPRRRGWLALIAAVGLAGLTPLLLRTLASGITPPADGATLSLWLTWQIPLAVAGTTLLMLAGWLTGLVGGRRLPPVVTLGALVAAGTLAVVGFSAWSPVRGWPAWYAWAWVPVFVAAALPSDRRWLLGGAAIVSGVLSAAWTWGAEGDGRVRLAERDVVGVRQEGDPIALGLLERFGSSLAGPAPHTSAELYRLWKRSPLEQDRYPAVLSLWRADGTETVRLALADLDLSPAVLGAAARAALEHDAPIVRTLPRTRGTHYVLAVPVEGNSVVTIGLGPRSRLIPPVRVARFLRGEPALPAPYTLSLGPPVPMTTGERVHWRREGRVAIGITEVQSDSGPRRLVAEVPLGTPSSLGVRGALVVVVDLAVIALFWLLGRHLAGGPVLRTRLRSLLARPSYRRRLAVAFAVFSVVPTVVFAGWIAARLREEARHSRDIATRQTLVEAVSDAGSLATDAPGPDAAIAGLADHLDADLLFYDDNELRATSVPILDEFGALDRYLPMNAALGLRSGTQPDYDADERIAGRLTRVGYRRLSDALGPAPVLAAPRLLEDPDVLRNEQDLVLGLMLVTLGGFAAAFLLGGLAARALATPVQALQRAAERVGRGDLPVPFAADVPDEFSPVMEAFERMADDVHASQAALVAQRQRTAAVLRNVATGVVAVDETFHVLTSNPRAEELLGVVLNAGDPLLELSPADWTPVWDWVRGAKIGAETGESQEFALGERQIRAQMAPLVGVASGWVVALDDVTDLAQAVRVLAWGELARQVAHEIKNPLTPIRLGIQHLQRAYDAPRGDYADTLHQTSRQILAEIERLDAIARTFSRFGAPPSGAEPLGPADVLAVAQDAAALYVIGGQGVRVVGVPVQALARRDELKEVLINLIENARGAGATAVTVRVGAMADGVEVAVEDNGRGIPANDLRRIFEPKFSTTTSGVGLGLAICLRLVESWGGQIAVQSAEGRGTTVLLTLRPIPTAA
jgi:signal transduction histidine kinase